MVIVLSFVLGLQLVIKFNNGLIVQYYCAGDATTLGATRTNRVNFPISFCCNNYAVIGGGFWIDTICTMNFVRNISYLTFSTHGKNTASGGVCCIGY